MFTSTKIIELGSCAFRQPQADSHCRFLHGYRLTAKFWFSAKHLDQNNWVVDFGGLKGLKKLMQNQFDHTTCISRTDPKLDVFKKLKEAGVCDLRIMDGVGIEKFAEYCHIVADSYVDELTDGRCSCVKVEVFEHENNSAIFEMGNSSTSGTQYMNDKAEEIEQNLPPAEEVAEDIATAVDNKQQTAQEEKAPPEASHNDAPEREEKRSLFKTEKTVNKWVNPKHKKTTNSWLF